MLQNNCVMNIGDKMPDYLGLDQNGNQIKAENLKGQKDALIK